MPAPVRDLLSDPTFLTALGVVAGVLAAGLAGWGVTLQILERRARLRREKLDDERDRLDREQRRRDVNGRRTEIVMTSFGRVTNARVSVTLEVRGTSDLRPQDVRLTYRAKGSGRVIWADRRAVLAIDTPTTLLLDGELELGPAELTVLWSCSAAGARCDYRRTYANEVRDARAWIIEHVSSGPVEWLNDPDVSSKSAAG